LGSSLFPHPSPVIIHRGNASWSDSVAPAETAELR
jgi:hypothetical protein